MQQQQDLKVVINGVNYVPETKSDGVKTDQLAENTKRNIGELLRRAVNGDEVAQNFFRELGEIIHHIETNSEEIKKHLEEK